MLTALQVHVLKAMRHPYIITYKESFMDKKCLCIVMDFADGGDLYTKIANQKKIGKGKRVELTRIKNLIIVCFSEDQIWIGLYKWLWLLSISMIARSCTVT